MKTSVLTRKCAAIGLPVLLIAGTILASSFRTATVNSGIASPNHKDTILIQKSQTSKKIKIKLYPNANHQVLFFSASGQDGKVFQLFLFDIDGKLVKQVNIRNKQTTVLNNIDKGNYLFEVFSDDERIENGQVIVK